MKSLKKLVFLTAAAVSFCGLLLAGCHTMQGFGQDISSGGKALSKAAGQKPCNQKKCSGK